MKMGTESYHYLKNIRTKKGQAAQKLGTEPQPATMQKGVFQNSIARSMRCNKPTGHPTK